MGTVANLVVKVSANLSSFEKDMQSLERRWSRTGSQLQSIGSTLTTSVTLPLAAIGGAALKMSTDFDTAMTKVRTLASESADNVARLRDSVLDLAPTVGIGPTQLADALLVIESTGFRGAEAMGILEMSAKASAIGMGNSKDVARALTAAVNAYGSENLSAAQAADILTATVDAGGAEADQLASEIGRVVGVASQLGVSFEQVGAFIATYTKLGLSASEATTGLSGVLNMILNPSREARKALGEVGMSAEGLRVAVKEQGLDEALIGLLDKVRGNGDAVGALFGNVRALAGVMGTAGSQAETYRAVLAQIQNSTNTLNERFNVWRTTTAATWAEFTAQVQVAAIQIGDRLAPAFSHAVQAAAPLVDGIGHLAGSFGQLPQPVQTLVVALGGLALLAGPLAYLWGTVEKVGAGLLGLMRFAGLGGVFASIYEGVMLVVGGFTGAVGGAGGLAGAFEALVVVMGGPVTATLALVVGGIGLVLGATGNLGAALEGTWSFIKGTTQFLYDLATIITAGVVAALQALANMAIWSDIASGFAMTRDAILAWIPQSVIDGVTWLLDKIKQLAAWTHKWAEALRETAPEVNKIQRQNTAATAFDAWKQRTRSDAARGALSSGQIGGMQVFDTGMLGVSAADLAAGRTSPTARTRSAMGGGYTDPDMAKKIEALHDQYFPVDKAKELNAAFAALTPAERANTAAVRDMLTEYAKLRAVVGDGVAPALEKAFRATGTLTNEVSRGDLADLMRATPNTQGLLESRNLAMGQDREGNVASNWLLSDDLILGARAPQTQYMQSEMASKGADMGKAFRAGLSNGVQDLGSVIVGAFMGGGNVMKSVFGHLGGEIGESLSTSVGSMLSKHLGKTMGGAIGGMLGPLGAALGPLVGELVGKIGKKVWNGIQSMFGRDEEARDVNPARDAWMAQFQSQFPGLNRNDATIKALEAAGLGGPRAAALMDALNRADTMAEFNAATKAIEDAIANAGKETAASLDTTSDAAANLNLTLTGSDDAIQRLGDTQDRVVATMLAGFDKLMAKLTEFVAALSAGGAAFANLQSKVSGGGTATGTVATAPTGTAGRITTRDGRLESFANEGIARRPMLAMIGDATEPEYVLHQSTVEDLAAGGGLTVNAQVTVNGAGGNATTLAREIVPALVTEIRRNFMGSRSDLRRLIGSTA
jgi:TP901 family phage tail tape measure protein